MVGDLEELQAPVGAAGLLPLLCQAHSAWAHNASGGPQDVRDPLKMKKRT